MSQENRQNSDFTEIQPLRLILCLWELYLTVSLYLFIRCLDVSRINILWNLFSGSMMKFKLYTFLVSIASERCLEDGILYHSDMLCCKKHIQEHYIFCLLYIEQ